MSIDPSAIIHESAKIHKGAIISPYAVIGANVEIDSGTVIDSHAVIEGPTKIGKNNHIYSFASIGGDPQDMASENSDFQSIGNKISSMNNVSPESAKATALQQGGKKRKTVKRKKTNNS